jgi:signal transduction histidine kinase/DNA-binding NarL/FixJ family response regulator
MSKKLFSLKIILMCGSLLPPLAIAFLTYLGMFNIIEPIIEKQNEELLKGRLETFASSIEQDIANGFYPSILQKSKLVFHAAKLGELIVQLNDGQILYEEKSQLMTDSPTKKYRTIKVPITHAGSTEKSAEIIASVNVEPSHDYATHLRELLGLTTILGAIIGAFVGLAVSFCIWKPLKRLIRAADGKGPEALSKYKTRSVFREIQALESALSGMGNRIVDLMEAQRKSERDVAIAGLTQMLAHDVRKPFSMLKIGLGILQASSNDTKKFKANLNLLVSEVERATKSVDGMLSDVMEIGSSSQELLQEPTSPDALIESTLGEIFRVYPKSNIEISYQLNHSNMVLVHVKKINRLFANIIDNALQAMNFSGKIWFKTQTKGNYIQFSIGNNGSMIPKENIPKLFEAFFTSGKKSGTGLGLAIAQKVVNAHGGQIWCESFKNGNFPDGCVEFHFTLPIAPNTELSTTAHLPKHSSQITQMIAFLQNEGQLLSNDSQNLKTNSDFQFYKSEELLHQELVEQAKAHSALINLLIVDDESIYRTALAGWIQDAPELSSICKIHHAKNSSEAIQIIQKNSIHLLITDIDMGPHSLNGFDLVKELRNTYNYSSLIFVHSNRIVPDDHRRAGNLGADGFLPKPMAKGQLLKLLLQTLYQLTQNPPLQSPYAFQLLCKGEPSPPQQIKVNPKLPKIAIIDDEGLFRDQWPPFLKGFQTILFARAEDFLGEWTKIKEELFAVITDKCLGRGMDGVAFGAILRAQDPNLPIILSTNDFRNHHSDHVFDLIIDKDAALEAPRIIQYIRGKQKASQA